MGEQKILTIRTPAVSLDAQLNESETARKLWNALPIEGVVNRWGEEIYFSVPVIMGEENASDVGEIGDIAYWPPGSAFCIFFGRTPASTGTELRAASAVNNLGKILGDAKEFSKAKSGSKIILEKKN